MDNPNLHYSESLLRIFEGNRSQIPQQWLGCVLWAADGVVYRDYLLLYIQCKQRRSMIFASYNIPK